MYYQQTIDKQFYDNCPKSVFAAIAVSYLLNLQLVPQTQITEKLSEEWDALYSTNNITQKPVKGKK